MIESLWSTLTPPQQIYWWGNICFALGFVVSSVIDVMIKHYRNTHGTDEE